MPYRIAICDDRTTDAEYVQKFLYQWAAVRQIAIQVDMFASSEQFLFRYAEDKSFDILLLDIEMGAMDGVTLARKIRRDNEAVQIIFITGYSDYIAEGYEVAALHYLMKPVDPEKLFAVLDRAVNALGRVSRAVLLPVDGDIVRLPVEQIQYAEAFSHSVAITTEKETLNVKLPLSEIETLLGNDFVRCHRSYLVSLKFISRLTKNEILLDNGKTLPLSRSAAAAVHQAFISYYKDENHETV